MRLSDLVVSKPGGLTTSETLAAGAVMIIMNPIPGQETRNSDFLLENGAAVKVNTIGTLAYKVTLLLRDPERLKQLRSNVARIARPRAAFDIINRAFDFERYLDDAAKKHQTMTRTFLLFREQQSARNPSTGITPFARAAAMTARGLAGPSKNFSPPGESNKLAMHCTADGAGRSPSSLMIVSG